ncbi:nuclear receptor corepressor 2-like isoform X2 [Triplophysa rosa]|uniref:nuclear receptor corepressor 2-like isoform X2 n=1 Tax=Triplophysa rosa TaxID=992332 RepID=UPI0025460986|nr:nuclear receptor corepressor 2-like isoform X2 [Triplophysa rosa]
MSSHPQPMPQGQRAVDACHLPSPATLPLQDVGGLVDYHPVAREYSSHLSHASLAHRRRPSLLSEFQPGNERGQEPHIRYDHIYLHEHSSHSEVDYSEMKRPRLEIGAESLIRHQTHRQALTVAGAEEMAKEHSSSSSIGKIEPVSPVSPVPMEPDLDLVPTRFSKEELIQNMDRVDWEITMVEKQICKLRKKQRQLEEEAAKPQEPERNVSPPPSEAKHRSLVQIIYDENRAQAAAAGAQAAGVPQPGADTVPNTAVLLLKKTTLPSQTRVPAPGPIQAQPGQTAQVTLTKPPPVVSVPAVVSSAGVTTLPVAGISVAIGQAQKAGGQVVPHPFQVEHVQQLLHRQKQQSPAQQQTVVVTPASESPVQQAATPQPQQGKGNTHTGAAMSSKTRAKPSGGS